jgi:hypothetical protein
MTDFFRYNVLDNPVLTGKGKGISQLFPEAGTPGATRGSEIGRSVANIGDVLGDTVIAPIRIGGAGIKDAGLGIYNFLSQPSATIPEDVRKQIIANKKLGISDSEIGRPDFVPDDYKPGDIVQGFAPLIEGKDTPPSAEDDYENAEDFLNVAEQMKNLEEKKNKDLYAGQEGKLIKDEPEPEPETQKTPSFESLFNASMGSYLASQGQEDTGKKTIEDYKKDFAEATGIDVSGKPDKSTALMALGLALMQNKAGKGFNVGKMLSAVGEAGEKALPAFEKAKQKAELGAAKAGEYALGKVAEDDAKAEEEKKEMLDRSEYYIIPKGNKDPKSMAQNFAKGQFKRLNKYELNNLVTNKEFNENYEVLSGDLYGDAFAEALKPPEAKDTWLTKPQKIDLFDEAPPEFQIDVFYADPNSGIAGGRPATNTDYLYTSFEQGEKKIQRIENDFATVIAATKAGGGSGISIQNQIIAFGQNFAKAFDIGTGTPVNSVTAAQEVLRRIQATEAANILQETGKTLSDNDRKLVARIVGEIDMSVLGANEDLLLEKLGQIYDLTVGKSRRNLESARASLKRFGVNIPTRQAYSDKFTETDKIVGIA